jgi:hypothetical protein
MGRDRHGIKIDRPTARRLFEAGRYVEQQPRSRVSPPSGPVDFGGSTMVKVTTALNPMSGSTPGANGRGKIQSLVGGSYADASSTVYPVLNDSEKTVAIGAYILCLPGPGGLLHWVIVDKCANLS